MRLFYHPESDCHFWVSTAEAESGEGLHRECFDVTEDFGHRAEALFEGVEEPPLFRPLPAGPFGLILADPAWKFLTYTGGGTPQRAEEQHYETLTLDQMKQLPVASIAAKDCVLVMWVIGSHLKMALDLGEAWGFKYKTDGFVWVKVGKGDPELRPISMGFWSRKQTEYCLLFTRGRPKRLDAGIRQLFETNQHVILAAKSAHSVKPVEQYDRCEKLADGPYCELFARQRREGWAGWGDEYPEDDPYAGL